jgi:tyrosyl-tRNA synthetase
MSKFIEQLQKRGFFHQATHLEQIKELLEKQSVTAYIGFDCTADSLHIGSLMQIMILRLLQKNGHQPLVLIGNGTTKIGDPSGKDSQRQLLNEENIKKNAQRIEQTLKKFDLSKKDNSLKPFKFIYNDQWLDGLNYIEFLRDFGKEFSVNKMLTQDSVKSRLDRQQPLSFLEFNYMILQSYDFFILNKKHNCQLQIGGSDQWGNIIQGVELVRRKSQNSVFGLTTPLLTNSQGKKMGKTENGAIWLNENKFSVFEYFQYFRNISDDNVSRFFQLFTEEDFNVDDFSDINKAKEKLAFEITKICHGEQKAQESLQKAQEIFVKKNNASFTRKEIFCSQEEKEKGVSLIEVIFRCQIFDSKAEGKRQIKGNAVKINGEKISDISFITQEKEFDLQVGKKNFFRVFVVLGSFN